MFRIFNLYNRFTKGQVGFIDDFMANFFVFSGIWKSKTSHRFNASMAVFNLTVLTVGFLSISYMLVLKYDDIDVNTEILLHFVEMFHSICTQLMFITKRKQIARLAEDADVTFDKLKLPALDQQMCLAVLHRERTAFRRVMRVACSAILTIYFSIAIDSNSLVNDKKKLPYPSWFPFETDDDHVVAYSLATGFQVLIYVEMLCVDLAVAGLWYATINKVSGLLEVLGSAFQDLAQDKQELVLLGSKHGEQTREFQERLRGCIELHIYINGLIKDLNASMGLIFLEVVLTSQVAICFCGYHVTQAVTTGERTRLFKYASGVMVFTLMLLVYCASGQKLKDKSERLYARLYACDWYERSAGFQKSLYFCQTITKKPLMVAHVLPADLHTFMSSMRAVFSYLNFLLAMKEKY